MSSRFIEHSKCVKGKERVISYLPLGHVAPQLLDVFTMMATAGACWFAQPNAMKVRQKRERENIEGKITRKRVNNLCCVLIGFFD